MADLPLALGTGKPLLNLDSEHYQKWTGIPVFYGCTYCGSKEQDSALVLLEQFTRNKILHVFLEALCLIYIIFLDFGDIYHDCRIKISLLSRRIHVF